MTLACMLLALALAPTGGETGRDLVFLAEDRPVFVRLRVTTGDRPFDEGWPASVQTLHACLDRDGDGTLTVKEADKDVLTAFVRLATGAAGVIGELNGAPKDGVVSIDELAAALRPTLGPFRVQVGRVANGRTDALFDHLDRDKDGALTTAELAAIASATRRLDLDDNELITRDELEPFNSPAAMARVEDATERRARYTAVPPVVELVAGESSLRLARLLLKKYDKGRDGVAGKPDSKLARVEFALDPDTFAGADQNGDDMIDLEELRRFIAGTPVDLLIDVAFAPDAGGGATVHVGGGGPLPKGVEVQRLADGDIELAVGRARLDVHVDNGNAAAENARRVLLGRFQAADANKDGYLEGKELTGLNTAASPLAGLAGIIDRDGDGELYAKELIDFADRQTAAARGRLVMTVSDQGRAIFGILDLNRDRRLSAREVMRTVERVTSWDADGDGRVTADEVPYHFLVTIARGELLGLAGNVPVIVLGAAAPQSIFAPAPNGPEWFRLMDRNHDGDVSRREFLGPREQFNRLDRDNDGLIDADEAGAAGAEKARVGNSGR
ncbi:MAG: hypothetical protein P4L84_23050 [Isosphaeraceae bacterium]|nr:hypothetical protein [Isosphaeraceae bacterium]